MNQNYNSVVNGLTGLGTTLRRCGGAVKRVHRDDTWQTMEHWYIHCWNLLCKLYGLFSLAISEIQL